MRVLVVYYSRTGNTKKVAEVISKTLKADLDEVVDLKNRRWLAGWIGGGRAAATKKLTEIKFKKDPSKYDLVVIGTPVWAGNMVPAVRTYLTKHKLRKVAFFATFGGREDKTFEEMEKISSKPVAVYGVKGKKEKERDIVNFCRGLK